MTFLVLDYQALKDHNNDLLRVNGINFSYFTKTAKVTKAVDNSQIQGSCADLQGTHLETLSMFQYQRNYVFK